MDDVIAPVKARVGWRDEPRTHVIHGGDVERFCDAIGAAAIARKPEYATAAARSGHRDALNAEIEAQTQVHTSADLIERLNAAGVPCGPIYSIDKMFADPQVRHLKVAQAVGGGKGRGLTLLAQPMSLSRTPSRLVRRPPGQGEHTGTVLKEFGFSKREIAALRQAKAI